MNLDLLNSIKGINSHLDKFWILNFILAIDIMGCWLIGGNILLLEIDDVGIGKVFAFILIYIFLCW